MSTPEPTIDPTHDTFGASAEGFAVSFRSGGDHVKVLLRGSLDLRGPRPDDVLDIEVVVDCRQRTLFEGVGLGSVLRAARGAIPDADGAGAIEQVLEVLGFTATPATPAVRRGSLLVADGAGQGRPRRPGELQA